MAFELASVQAGVTKNLQEFLASHRPHVSAIGSHVDVASEALSDFVVSGGKRVRPLYAWAGYVGGGGDESNTAVQRACSSLEFIQACALIHDDIIDASDTRRGNPTVHRRMETYLRDYPGFSGPTERAAEFGTSVAILIGDLALVWAEDMFMESGVELSDLMRARPAWNAMRAEVIGGQILDISAEAVGETSEDTARRVNIYKTASYTITRPLQIGGLLAGVDDSTLEAFAGYGRNLGIAFQLRDDLLGVFGDPSVTGKPAGDDLREGKRTELLAVAVDKLNGTPEAQYLLDNVGTTSDPATLARLADIIRASGAADDMECRIATLRDTGLSCLDTAAISDDATAILKELAIKTTQRTK